MFVFCFFLFVIAVEEDTLLYLTIPYSYFTLTYLFLVPVLSFFCSFIEFNQVAMFVSWVWLPIGWKQRFRQNTRMVSCPPFFNIFFYFLFLHSRAGGFN